MHHSCNSRKSWYMLGAMVPRRAVLRKAVLRLVLRSTCRATTHSDCLHPEIPVEAELLGDWSHVREAINKFHMNRLVTGCGGRVLLRCVRICFEPLWLRHCIIFGIFYNLGSQEHKRSRHYEIPMRSHQDNQSQCHHHSDVKDDQYQKYAKILATKFYCLLLLLPPPPPPPPPPTPAASPTAAAAPLLHRKRIRGRGCRPRQGG